MKIHHHHGGDFYRNPIIPKGNTPDPTVIQYGRNGRGQKLYDMVTTTEGSAHGLAIRQSTDLVHWSKLGSVITPGHGLKWTHSTRCWAPEIYHFGNKFQVYFASQEHNGKMAIGLMESKRITGPWHDPIGKPLLEPAANGNESYIDPVILADPKTRQKILYYTVQPGSIYAQPLEKNGLAVNTKQPRTLVLQAQDQVVNGVAKYWPPAAWESLVNEGPEPFHHGGYYYMLYSGAWTQNGSYALGVARSLSPFGPFEKKGAPILHGDSHFDGTGHCSRPIRGPNGQWYILHHGYRVGHEQYSHRHLFIEPMTFQNGWPVLGVNGHPIEGRQPAP